MKDDITFKKEPAMPKLSWFDRIIIKVVIAKTAARGTGCPDHTATKMMAALDRINSSVDTSRQVARAE